MKTWHEAVLREFNLYPLWVQRSPLATSSALSPPVLAPPAAARAAPSLDVASSSKETHLVETAPVPDIALPAKESQTAEIATPLQVSSGAAASITSVLEAGKDDWKTLNNQVLACVSCTLRPHCDTPLLGEQNHADWLFISEAQGADAGENQALLTAMLAAMQLRRGHNVAVVPALKCSLLNQRAPSAEQVAQCAPFLQRQIALLQPKIIILLGKTAVMAVMASSENLGSLRGRRHDYHGIPLIVTYHPAYLLRMPAEKAHAWQDLKLAMQIFKEGQSS